MSDSFPVSFKFLNVWHFYVVPLPGFRLKTLGVQPENNVQDLVCFIMEKRDERRTPYDSIKEIADEIIDGNEHRESDGSLALLNQSQNSDPLFFKKKNS